MKVLLGIVFLGGYFALAGAIVAVVWYVLDSVMKDTDGADNLKFFLLFALAYYFTYRILSGSITSAFFEHVLCFGAAVGTIFLGDKIKSLLFKR